MKIDDIIKNKKDLLDVEQPPEELWVNILKEWKKETKSYMKIWKVAAILLLTSTIALLIYTQSLQNQVMRAASLGDISKEYKLLEKDYTGQIEILEASLPLDEIRSNKKFDWLIDELNTLDEINKMYQNDLGKGVAKEQLVGVLIDYYEKRIKLLKKLDLELKRVKKANNKERETIQT